MIAPSKEFMGIEAFEGGNGHLVIMQEFPHESGERYVRIMTDMSNAEALCSEIMAVARRARSK
jgi:hypothetical protein